MIRFEDLLEKVRAYSPDADVEMLRRAYVFSAFEHRGQVRRSGEPYLIHPLAVAEFLVELKLDAVAIAAGLLHDVVEDTLTTIERIRELFGPEVAHVVEGVTKISAIPFSSTEERQAVNFRKMLLAMVDFPHPEGPTIRPMFQGFSVSGRFTCHVTLDVSSMGRSNIPRSWSTRGVSSIADSRTMR